MNKPLLLVVFILAVVSFTTLIKLRPYISLFQTEQLKDVIQKESNNQPTSIINTEDVTEEPLSPIEVSTIHQDRTPGTVLNSISEEDVRAVSEVVKDGLASEGSDAFNKFRTLQQNLATTLTMPSDKRTSMRVLIASSVSSRVAAVGQFTEWLQFFNNASKRQIDEFGVGDEFEFALNHYDNDTSNWDGVLEEYSSQVVLNVLGYRCKTFLWKLLDVNFTDKYDYVWLVDDDISFKFSNWELTRSILTKLKPLVVHPGVLPVSSSKRASDHPELVGKIVREFSTGRWALAVNEGFAEVMAPMISRAFWPFVHKRLDNWSLRSVWCLDCFWSRAAVTIGGEICGHPAPLIVLHASPILHINSHSIDRSKELTLSIEKPKKATGCIKHKVGTNRVLSIFHKDILNPKTNTIPEDRDSFRVMQEVVKPRINCLEKNSGGFVKKKKWTLQELVSI